MNKQPKYKLRYDWKKHGLNMEDFDNIYDRYVNTECCDICKCSFENTKNVWSIIIKLVNLEELYVICVIIICLIVNYQVEIKVVINI